MFIGIKIGPRLFAGFAVVLLALLALWGVAAYELGRAGEASTTLNVVAGVGLVLAVVANWLLARSITLPLAKAVRLIEAVASGDLSHAPAVQSRDEIGRLFSAIHAMREQLGVLVAEARGGAAAVAEASSQIAQGHVELSQRTEEQAGTLEETAGAMVQLSTTVAQNADHARQASVLATSACAVAERGREVVGRLETTMGGIAGAARRMGEIIGVIDGIAFQTNILALNAAVEAARAGGQGRGFAVVAAEVRVLAQRSAAAAREIKGLIANSEREVGAGSLLAEQAGTTLREAVAAVEDVTRLIAQIASASGEQSAGIAQVATAIRQMEGVVQQNAALTEQAVAATDAMKDEAAGLLRMVLRFRLSQGAGAAHAPVARPPATLGYAQLANPA
ncbi:MAG TPA: methyl-accepting chemotaxis protein [Ramlibacter sp.]|jgi:methyl-accepting chemotaxis protein